MANNIPEPEIDMITPVMETAEQIVARLDRTLVPVYLPMEGAGGETSMFLGLNGKTWLVPRGKNTFVPRPVASLIRQKQHAQEEARRYDEEQRNRCTAAALN